ncbi:MAG TPA: DNA primase [Accumulibacter sp.]|uniref:DNA primase n=1 Tax=Accumulibacter sp. TaxID=2053492 RepID=UPI0028792C91|nr:DNA primase [Accumulibacter sp.]MDS4054182.1 DNA primase [Accumulibacter sp.]HNF92694.1 DNA primase [Accumulibacter sp.]
MTPAEKFLSRVEHRQTGPGRWLFRVPTRKDRHMSGTVRETDDGVLLVHDFGGDPVHDILDAIGLRASDLFPERRGHSAKAERRPFPAADVLRAIAFEAMVVAAAGAALLAGEPLTAVDRERLILAVSRIQAALTAAGVSHG